MEETLGVKRRPVLARCVGRVLLSHCAHRRVRLPIDASGSNLCSREEDARCHLINLQAARRSVGRQIRPHSSRPLVTGSRSSSSQGTLRHRVRRPASALLVVASGCPSLRRAARNRVGLLVGSPGDVRRLRRNSSRLVGIAHRPQRARHRVRGSSSLRQQGWPPLHREDRLAQTGSNLCVRLLVTAEIVASWSSISKQFIAQQVVASRSRSASRQKTRKLAWCRVRRLIVVASGGRLWVYQAASRHVRKPLVAFFFHQDVARSSS